MCNTFTWPLYHDCLNAPAAGKHIDSELPAYPCVWIGGPAQLWCRLCCIQQHHWEIKKEKNYEKTHKQDLQPSN